MRIREANVNELLLFLPIGIWGSSAFLNLGHYFKPSLPPPHSMGFQSEPVIKNLLSPFIVLEFYGKHRPYPS